MTGGDGVKDGGSLVRGGKVGEWRQGKNGEGGKAGWPVYKWWEGKEWGWGDG